MAINAANNERDNTMSQQYSDPKRASDPHALPNIEVFYVSPKEAAQNAAQSTDDEDYCSADGWYWQACFPGCLPDGEPFGPFETEAEAIAHAQEGVEFFEDEPTDDAY